MDRRGRPTVVSRPRPCTRSPGGCSDAESREGFAPRAPQSWWTAEFDRGSVMATARLQGVIHHLGLAVAARDSAGVPDAQLVQRFVRQRDEAAFELLVWRHGKMVLGTCRRLLRDAHEAEDA